MTSSMTITECFQPPYQKTETNLQLSGWTSWQH